MAPCYSLCNLQHYTKRRMLVEAVSALCPACVLNVIHDRFSHYQSYILLTYVEVIFMKVAVR